MKICYPETIELNTYVWLTTSVVKWFVSSSQVWYIVGSSPGWVKQKTMKLVFVAFKINCQITNQVRDYTLDCLFFIDMNFILFQSCSYFTSNAVPLKLVFKNSKIQADPVYSMFKVNLLLHI
jgi:ketopantoate hydroxymethyltransferase